MELTIANVWPGADVTIGVSKFSIRAVETPRMWLTSPRGIALCASVCAGTYVDDERLPYPGRFERTGRSAKPYSIAGHDVWGYAFSVPSPGPYLLAVWSAPHGLGPLDMAQTHAIGAVEKVLADGGDHEAATFLAALGHGVAVGWDLKPFPPFERYVVGNGWQHLEGYWEYQMQLESGTKRV